MGSLILLGILLAVPFSYVNADSLTDTYGKRPLKILVVPGHDDESSSGAEFRGLREKDLNLTLGKALAKFLSLDPKLSVTLLRDENGFRKDFQEYLKSHAAEIDVFRKERRSTASQLRKEGLFQRRTVVSHNRAPADDIQKLYGINKWADELGFDLLVHIHFNDHPDHFQNSPGKYTGLAIYIPEKQLVNNNASLGIARSVLSAISQYFPISDYKKERTGLVEDQELIAVGANNSLKAASILIEYGYIYESQFTGSKVREAALRELAYQTYRGLEKYLDKGSKIFDSDATLILPYNWTTSLKKGEKNSEGVFALQIALLQQGLYPPPGFSKNNCGLTGNLGICTETSLKAFQRKYRLPVTGVLDKNTINKLNSL